jgi:hypothetical protein
VRDHRHPPIVRDHRTKPVVRDHRTETTPPTRGDRQHGGFHGGGRVPPKPVVRDHRTEPVVRDHREKPIVRDHRNGPQAGGIHHGGGRRGSTWQP